MSGAHSNFNFNNNASSTSPCLEIFGMIRGDQQC
jgi:hypothetical protein